MNDPIIIANKIYRTIIQTQDELLLVCPGQFVTVWFSLQELEHAIFTPPLNKSP